MVWFQCEDCGENLKKPKLANHFRMCSAFKLSCIDCGQMFDQESVQSHNQCITEAEKYGPKGQGIVSHNGQIKPDKPKKNSDVDINVGLSSRLPWFCSLCNTQATSKQTLLLHADGKKHRAKARAYHASQKQSSQSEEPILGEKAAVGDDQKVVSAEANGSDYKVLESDAQKNSDVPVTKGEEESHTRKRKFEASEDGVSNKNEEKIACDFANGEVIQGEHSEAPERKSKKKKHADESSNCKDHADKEGCIVEASQGKIKWKKLVTSILKLSNGVMKIKKLQKLIVTSLKRSGVTEDVEQLQDKLMDKISTSTRFTIEDKCIRLVAKSDDPDCYC